MLRGTGGGGEGVRRGTRARTGDGIVLRRAEERLGGEGLQGLLPLLVGLRGNRDGDLIFTWTTTAGEGNARVAFRVMDENT